MTRIVSNKWCDDDFCPMDAIPTAVCLTTYDGGRETSWLHRSMSSLGRSRAILGIQVGKTFRLEIIEAHRYMEENRAGGKIVVLT